MVYDHVIYDLNYIFNFHTYILGGYDYLIGDTSAVLFMILCGISTNLSKNNLKHGLLVFGCAMSLTVITNLLDFFARTSLSINFGILHFLGISMILAHFIKKLNIYWIALITIISYPMPIFLKELNLPGNWLFPLGIHDNCFYSSDYYPLFPYISFILFGLLLGKILYKNRVSLFRFTLPDNPISFLGRNSLVFYITHQPVVLMILYCIFYFIPKK
jgi:uncharacterized membrane protein